MQINYRQYVGEETEVGGDLEDGEIGYAELHLGATKLLVGGHDREDARIITTVYGEEKDDRGIRNKLFDTVEQIPHKKAKKIIEAEGGVLNYVETH